MPQLPLEPVVPPQGSLKLRRRRLILALLATASICFIGFAIWKELHNPPEDGLSRVFTLLLVALLLLILYLYRKPNASCKG
jgi:hypothetical protein